MGNEGDIIIFLLKVLGIGFLIYGSAMLLMLIVTFIIDSYFFREIRNDEDDRD